MKKKIMLIVGCSHACGSEIDGQQDSLYNREKSFGGQFARMIGYEPVNIASVGSTNPTIARSVIEWVSENYNPEEMNLCVLIAWTEATRMEVPSIKRTINYHEWNSSTPWVTMTDTLFYRINLGHEGGTPDEREIFPSHHRFMVDNSLYLEIYTLNLILQIQYFLSSKNIDYIMCSTMGMVSESVHNESYVNQIDKSKYMDWDDNTESFWWLYKRLNYVNPLAKYWHHGLEPHTLFAKKLYNFFTNLPERE